MTQGNLYKNRGQLLSAHGEFMDITADRYHAMEQRIAEKFAGLGVYLPFTLEDYRVWIREQLGGEQGLTRCEYCCSPIDIHTMQVDHRVPLAQACLLDFANLCLVCEPCNSQKGSMRSCAFVQLLNLVNSAAFNDIDRTDCLGRLQMAIKLARKEQARQAAARGRSAPAQRVVAHIRLPKGAA